MSFVSDLISSLSSPSSIRALALAATLGLSYLSLPKKKAGYKKQLERKVEVDEKLASIELDSEDYIELLGKIIANVRYLQNGPNNVPKEELVADIVIDYLKPFTKPNGPLEVKKFNYAEGRSNVIVKFPGSSDKYVSFVGSHMDVVPANPTEWERDPFKLTVEGKENDRKLFGRGVTDCLGHVAMITQFFRQLAQLNPKTNVGFAAVFIASEEYSQPNQKEVGIEALAEAGELEFLKGAPLFWVDSADIGPTLGTGTVQAWQLTVNGKSFHSGLPHLAINSINLAGEAIAYVQKRFYQDFPFREIASETYKYQVGSSFKPTKIFTDPNASLNIIPGKCTIQGDMRLVPFDKVELVRSKIEEYVNDFNTYVIPQKRARTFGYDKFELVNETKTNEKGEVQGVRGYVQIEWLDAASEGYACDFNSFGFKALCDAIMDVTGKVEPFSLTGSLPLIADLQKQGFDVQVTGFGVFKAYHAANEYAELKGFQIGTKVFSRVCALLNSYLK